MIVEVKIKQTVDVDINIKDIVDEINELPILDRINQVGHLINAINSDDIISMADAHKAMIKDWLERQLKRFES